MNVITREHKHGFFGYRRATYSMSYTFRYVLDVRFGARHGAGVATTDFVRTINFIMLNPSTATEKKNDPTIERCERRAKKWGYGRLIITNLFAYRATDPKEMKRQALPEGKHNDHFIVACAEEADMVVCAWGAHGTHRGRAERVLELLRGKCTLHALKVGSDGQPSHPLYIGYAAQPIVWRAA